MAESKLAALSMDFAVKVLRLCDSIKGHYSLVNQLERSGTSIGANIREANYAHSRPDFIAKFQIALKECYETEYWLELLERAEIRKDETISAFVGFCSGTLFGFLSMLWCTFTRSFTTKKRLLPTGKRRFLNDVFRPGRFPGCCVYRFFFSVRIFWPSRYS